MHALKAYCEQFTKLMQCRTSVIGIQDRLCKVSNPITEMKSYIVYNINNLPNGKIQNYQIKRSKRLEMRW